MYSEDRENAIRDIVWGVGLIVVFGGISLASYAAAGQAGGAYFILWGPEVYGGFRLIRGLVRLTG